ncbi:MAG: histidine phosphotransferase [Alphaproteobacteria bacterium]|nr:histidine phosphotransferase [Alphaproteobacteria bacterium]
MTPPTIDIRIVQLLFSRVCHDLAGPIGAVNNGMELVSEMPSGDDAEALTLIGQSARQAAAELEFARLAFGFGGGSAGTYLADAERLCKALFTTERVRVAWQANLGDSDLPKDVAKLLVNLALAGQQALRGRGSLSISVGEGDTGIDISIRAEGPGAVLRPEYRETLSGFANLPNMTPAAAQGYYAFGLAQFAGGAITIDESEPDRVVLLTTAHIRH